MRVGPSLRLVYSLIALLLCFKPLAAQVGGNDTMPPQLAEFSFSPSTVDVSDGSKTVTISVRITDDVSGFGGGSVQFYRMSPYAYAPFSLISGTPLNGTYLATITIPRYSPPGVWQPVVTLQDYAGNYTFFDAARLAALGFPLTCK